MAIVTDRTITIHGVEVGISKPIQTLIANGDFTYNELSKFAFVGRHDFINDFIGIYDSDLQETGSAGSLLAKNKYPVMNDPSGAWSNIKYLYTGKGERPHDAYGKMVLVYNRTSASSAIQNNYSDSNSACIVTDINPRLLKMIPNITHSTVTATYGEPGTYDIYDAEASLNIKWYDDNSTAPFSTLCVQKYDEYEYFIFPLYDNRATSTEVISGNTGGTKARMYYMNDAFNRPGNKYISPWAQTDDIDDFASGASYSSTWNCVNKVNTDRANRNLILKYRGNPYYEGTVYVKASDLDAILKQCAGCGLYFEYNSTIYKPVVEDGIVTGYTDDLMHNSEWDLINDVTGNTVPDAPPSPTPPTPSGDDDIDSMGFDGMSCSVGGPAKYYVMSYSDIHHLIGDFNAHAEPGTSISNNIISCYVNALDWNWTTGSEPIEIYSGGAQTVAFTSDINYDVITGYNARDIIGSIDVPRMTNTFYDFAPYSTYEVYVPFCGWVALPDTVAGRNIKIYFETDEATCGCKGRVFFVDNNGNGVTVAEITGSFGAPCPIQILEGGLYKQAMLSNGLQVIGGIASGVMGGAMGAGALAVSGLSSAMQSLGNCLIAGNTNYGQTIGRAGDASGLMCAGKPYLKITYPPLDEVVNNSRFGHTIGYLCNTVGKLSAFSGFTVCANPHITGINCTDSEKEELKRLLEEGVIL